MSVRVSPASVTPRPLASSTPRVSSGKRTRTSEAVEKAVEDQETEDPGVRGETFQGHWKQMRGITAGQVKAQNSIHLWVKVLQNFHLSILCSLVEITLTHFKIRN